MRIVKDFEEMLEALNKHGVQYLIVGGIAYIYHAKPRYTKDIDIWINNAGENVEKTNRALSGFGSPYLVDKSVKGQVVQIGIAPNRIDLILEIEGFEFNEAWKQKVIGRYGKAETNWIDLDSLIEIKRRIRKPRHQEDARVLMEVRKMITKKVRKAGRKSH